MPIYHFIVDYTKEFFSKRKNIPRSNKNKGKSTVIILAKNYDEARQKLHNYLSQRKQFTDNIDDYNIQIDWIDHNHSFNSTAGTDKPLN